MSVLFRHDIAPQRLLLAFLVAHTTIWTLVPTLLHAGLPLDLVEGYAIAREWVIGYFKHPALPWWLLEATRAITGQVGWPAYLLSASLVALTYALTYGLGRDMMSERHAITGALLLSGVLYFSWVVPEYNHNIAQMPLWLGFIWALWRARATDRVHRWIAVGFLAALGLYAKFTHGVLLAVAAAYIVIDAKLRARILTAGPWLALATFAVCVSPLAHWLIRSEFLALDYAAERAQGGRAGSVGLFVLKQIASMGGLFALALLGGFATRTSSASPANTEHIIAPDALRFLLWFFAGPFVLIMVLALASRTGLKGSWGTPMLSLAGLLAVAWAGPRVTPQAVRRIAIGAAALLALVPIAHAIAVMRPSGKLLTPHRTSWPQAEIAQEMQKIWREATGQPLHIVAGDLWAAGMVSAHATDRPQIFIDGTLRLSPWIKQTRLQRDGFLAVWWRTREDPPDYLREWIGERIDGKRVFTMRNGDRGETATVYFTIVKPGALKP